MLYCNRILPEENLNTPGPTAGPLPPPPAPSTTGDHSSDAESWDNLDEFFKDWYDFFF